MRLGGQFQSARYIAGIFAEQDADQIFLLLRFVFRCWRNGGGRGVDELFGLAHIEQRSAAVVGQQLREPQRILIGGERLPRDLNLQILLAQGEVRGGDVGYQ